MKSKNLYEQIIDKRHKAILTLIKNGKDLKRIERETALLVFDVLGALQIKSISLKAGCGCFVSIDHSLGLGIRERLSEDFHDLLMEAELLDEAGTKYGPDITLLRALATRILQRDQEASQLQLREFIAALKAEQKSAKTSVAVV